MIKWLAARLGRILKRPGLGGDWRQSQACAEKGGQREEEERRRNRRLRRQGAGPPLRVLKSAELKVSGSHRHACACACVCVVTCSTWPLSAGGLLFPGLPSRGTLVCLYTE